MLASDFENDISFGSLDTFCIGFCYLSYYYY